MKLVQIRDFQDRLTAAIFEDGRCRPVAGHTMLSLIRQAEDDEMDLADLAEVLASQGGVEAALEIPISPPEVWACGCTYAPSAEFRDGELGTRDGMYSYVYRAERPEIFFKGTARVCVGPGQPIGIRCDSKFTAPEPELAVVLGSQGNILAYTLANDVSAWDIERENALYLPQSKVYSGCCALGPALVTADEITDPYSLEMTCTITRNSNTIFSGSISTSKLYRRLEQLISYLTRANPVLSGTVVLTGTGIIVTEDAALQPADEVSIEVPEIGRLTNPAATVGSNSV